MAAILRKIVGPLRRPAWRLSAHAAAKPLNLPEVVQIEDPYRRAFGWKLHAPRRAA